MKKHQIVVPVTEVTTDELSDEQKAVVEAAKAATGRSYAPYSNFNVGAAILLENGEIIAGSNQENAAFPSGLCAERTACFYAGARYPDVTMRMVAIAARDAEGRFTADPLPPCGACRQSLLEYELRAGRPIELLLAGDSKVLILPSVASTLPLSFTSF